MPTAAWSKVAWNCCSKVFRSVMSSITRITYSDLPASSRATEAVRLTQMIRPSFRM
ncbi:hypothetical protein D3C83_205530 [compost metagenome]